QKANEIIKEYDVRPPRAQTLARSLSGGNQQKVIIGREIDRSPHLLIAAQPTRGLDVGAVEFIHKKLIEERDKGRAVLLMYFERNESRNDRDQIADIYNDTHTVTADPHETKQQDPGLITDVIESERNQNERYEHKILTPYYSPDVSVISNRHSTIFQ